MKGFRIDKAEGGFIVREIHPDTKHPNRKYGAASSKRKLIKLVTKWIKNL